MPITAIISKIESRQATVGVIGLGYVARPPSSGRGLPLALCFAEKGSIVGFDIDEARLAARKDKPISTSCSVEELKEMNNA